jgi:hypothetical protein
LGLTGTFEPYQKKELSIINLGVAVGRRMEIPNTIKPWTLAVIGTGQLVQQCVRIPLRFYLRGQQHCQEVILYEQCWIGKVCTLEPSAVGYSRRKKEARCFEPGSMRLDLTELFSLDPLSSVLSFSF